MTGMSTAGIGLALLLALSWPGSALAAGELTAQSLSALCNSEAAAERRACQAYLQGFVDGALTTDPTVAVNVAEEAQRSTDRLTERAIRTRVRDRLAQFGASVYAEFCPPDPLPLGLIENVIAASTQQAGGPVLARDLLYDVVRREFPCT